MCNEWCGYPKTSNKSLHWEEMFHGNPVTMHMYLTAKTDINH